MRSFGLLGFLLSASLAATPATVVAHLPNTGIAAAKVDAAGNIYIAGFNGTPTSPDTYDAFVAKLSPDGSRILYSTTFAGSKSDYATALEIDSSGAAYIIGETQSSDFPVTQAAVQGTFLASSKQGFVAKVDPQGKVVYATFIGGSSDINLSVGGLVVNTAGEAIVSGQTIGGNFPTTSPAPFNSTDTNTFFVLKLDVNGAKLLASVRGVGGRVALDGQSNIYVSGLMLSSPTAIPITPGAFQTTFQLRACGGTGQLGIPCSYQYVTKLNATLTQLLYSTFVTGTYGASPAAIFVDAQGNAIVAGTTHSPDYPTTNNSFEPIYIANAPYPLVECLFGCNIPPPATGYVTKLNAAGTGLMYSTFFSGTQSDTITFATLTAGGIYLAGQAGSADLPGLDGLPLQCLPETFVTRLSLDGSSVTAARIAPDNILTYDSVRGSLLAWNGADLVRFDPTAPPAPIACILDAADLRPVTQIAPGELLSIFGPRFVSAVLAPASRGFPLSLGGVSVAFSGTASPLLYVSPQQINVQAPYEIADAGTATITLTSSELSISDSRTLPVVSANPTIFLDAAATAESTGFNHCSLGGSFLGGLPLTIPLAFNSDGTRNSCANPAPAGSTVRIFLSGLGTIGEPVTGSINPSPGPPLGLPISTNVAEVSVVAATAAPGSISGVWQADLKVTGHAGAIPVSFFVDIAPQMRIPVRDTNLTIWTR
jgi:uncharacterized protein (TIGR03437 family)